MTKINFETYQQVIENSIQSCITIEQLHCCWDMIERFEEVFKPIVGVEEVSKAANWLMFKYSDKKILLPF